MASGQLTLDFLCQSGPQAALTAAERSERTLFAERLGDVNLRWLLLQREMEIQVSTSNEVLGGLQPHQDETLLPSFPRGNI